MRALLRVYDGVIVALTFMAGVSVAVILLLVLIDVTSRELFGNSLRFAIPIVEYGLLYFAMFAAPYLVRQKGHVYVEAAVSQLPAGGRRVAEKLAYLVCIIATGIFAYISFDIFFDRIGGTQLDIRGISFPNWIIIAPLGPCYALVATEFLRYLVGRDSYYAQETARRDAL